MLSCLSAVSPLVWLDKSPEDETMVKGKLLTFMVRSSREPRKNDIQTVLYVSEAAMLVVFYEGDKKLKAKQNEASVKCSVFFLVQTREAQIGAVPEMLTT